MDSLAISPPAVALLEFLTVRPVGVYRESIPPILLGTALAECLTFGYAEFVDGPLLKDAKRRRRDWKRRGLTTGPTFDGPFDDQRLRITAKGTAALTRKQMEAQRIEAAKTRWSKPDTPSRLAKHFGCKRATFVKRVKEGTILAKKLSDRSYQVPIECLSDESVSCSPPPKSH